MNTKIFENHVTPGVMLNKEGESFIHLYVCETKVIINFSPFEIIL